MTTSIKSITTAALTMFCLLTLTPLAPSLAQADDDYIICWEYPLNGGWETECDTRGNYKAECKLTDPENTTEFCQDINSENPMRDDIPQALSDGSGTVDAPRPGDLRR